MITKFKLFENNETDLLKYVGTFLLNNENNEKGEEGGVAVCANIYYKDDDDIFADFDYFEFKDNKIIDFYSDHESFTQDKFNSVKNVFMTPSDFYNNNPEYCEKFYIEICNELKKDILSYWRIQTLKNCKKVLESIPELQHYVDAEKYNL